MKLHNLQILLIRLALAGLFLNLGIGKINQGWLRNTAPLTEELQNFQQHASGYHLGYLTHVAIPYASLWSRLIAIGEAAIGVSLLLGLLVRLSSAIGIFMVLNLHAGTGTLFSLKFFGSPSASLLIAALIAVLLAAAGRWIGIDQLLAKSRPGSKLY
jgi:thiosulfate dehydrogenase (quinone) large subunit